MPKKDEKIPDEFKTYEEAAEFWESHDSTDYLDILEEVEIKVNLQKRRASGKIHITSLKPQITHLNSSCP